MLVILSLQRIAVILNTPIDRCHLVNRIIDQDPRSEEIGREDYAAVREPELGVLELVVIRLALLVLFAIGEMTSQPGSHFLVIFKVAETLAEFTCRRHPYEHTRIRLEIIRQLGCAHSKGTEVIADHRLIGQSLSQMCRFLDARGVRRTHVLIGDQAAIHSQPERKVAFDAPRAGQRHDSRRYCDMVVEGVVQISGEYHLGTQALRSV